MDVTGEGEKGGRQLQIGQLLPNSTIVFDKAESSQMTLAGKSKGCAHLTSSAQQCSLCLTRVIVTPQQARLPPDSQSRLGLLQDGRRRARR